MADIPLNHFIRKAFTLTSSPSAVYVSPFDRAAIILGAYATNTTSSDTTITLSISGVGGTFVDPRPQYDYAKNILVAGNDTMNMAPGRIVLEEYDALIASCGNSGSVTLNLAILETINTVE